MDSADWDTHSEYSDRHRPVGSVADSDFEERRNIRELKVVGWDKQDCWNRDSLVAFGSDTGYPDREDSRRIAAAGFDKDHRPVESNPGRLDILVPSGNPD